MQVADGHGGCISLSPFHSFACPLPENVAGLLPFGREKTTIGREVIPNRTLENQLSRAGGPIPWGIAEKKKKLVIVVFAEGAGLEGSVDDVLSRYDDDNPEMVSMNTETEALELEWVRTHLKTRPRQQLRDFADIILW